MRLSTIAAAALAALAAAAGTTAVLRSVTAPDGAERHPAGATQLVEPAVRGGALQQDPQELDPRLREKTDRDLRERPAFQQLPVDEEHLTVELIGSTRDGRAVLLVTSDRPEREARRLYGAWLRRWGDSGAGYVAMFRTPGEAGRAHPSRRSSR